MALQEAQAMSTCIDSTLAQPVSIAESGLSQSLLEDIVARQLHATGVCDIREVSLKTALSAQLVEIIMQLMKADARVEVLGPAIDSQALRFKLTEAGRVYATEARFRSGYMGPAPISLESYRALIHQQSVFDLAVTRDAMTDAFSDVVVKPYLLDRLGSAMHSGKAMFIYGPAGTGKTFICKQLIQLLKSPVYIPYAVVVGDSIVKIYDESVHEELDAVEATSAYMSSVKDRRLVYCKRPFVCSGGELTADLLEIQHDAETRQYIAPLQLKATHGIYMIDDLGRQRMSTDELFNRWIVPMESGEDFLNLQSGQRMAVPFDVILIFSTNLLPENLDDPAFQRRIGHKIKFDYADEEIYSNIWRQVCGQRGILFDSKLVTYAIEKLHKHTNTPMLACHPRDLIGMALDYNRYSESNDVLTHEALDLAWDNYFAQSKSANDTPI